jgi:hypothetical protein
VIATSGQWVLSSWRSRVALDHCHDLGGHGHSTNITATAMRIPAPSPNPTLRLVGDIGILCIRPHSVTRFRRTWLALFTRYSLVADPAHAGVLSFCMCSS